MRSNSFQPLAPPTVSANTTEQSHPVPSTDDNNKATPIQASATPITGPANSSHNNNHPNKQDATPTSDGLSFTVKQLQCPNERRPFVLHDEFEKLVLKQCTSSRFKIRPAKWVTFNYYCGIAWVGVAYHVIMFIVAVPCDLYLDFSYPPRHVLLCCSYTAKNLYWHVNPTDL